MKSGRAVLREAVRAIVEEALSEAVQLTPQQFAAKQALGKVNNTAAVKAGLLFSRILTKRITPEEVEQMAGEVRSMAASDPKAVKLFDTALDDAQEGVTSASRIGDMISSTLAQPAQAPKAAPQTFTMRSVAKA